VDWIHLAEDRELCQALENIIINIRIPEKVGNFLIAKHTTSFSRKTLHHGVSFAAAEFRILCLIVAKVLTKNYACML
jgi:hypothetical protein